MDTSVLPSVLPVTDISYLTELTEADRKVAKREARAERNAGFGSTIGGLSITSNYLSQVTLGVTEALSGPRPRSNTYDFRLQRLLRSLDPEVIALALLQASLRAAGTMTAPMRSAVLDIGTALNNELWAAKLLQTDAKLARKISKAVKEKYGSVELRQNAAKRMAAKGDADGNAFTMQEWSLHERVHAGTWGMNLLLQTMPEVFELADPETFKGDRVWRITEQGREMAKAAVTEMVLRSPVYQPRTEAPKPWDSFVMRVAQDDRTLDRSQLLRTFHKDVMSAARHGIRTGTMAPALKGLNALQAVPFKINTWIMDVIAKCYEHGIKVEGLPRLKDLDVPKRMADEDFVELDVGERRLLSKTIRGLKKANRANDADTVQYAEDMETALRTADAPRFYTPMNWDWRTRTYALTRFNFQREDRVRSMFLFANGKPIGDEGIWWLKVHVANCGAFKGEDKIGIDKKPFEERVKWIDDNLDDLRDYVKRPLYRTEWTQADSPFLFLAGCRELVQAIDVGASYVTHMPTSWDGACNGLQHLCLMTRDPQGRLVNLTNNAAPLDIYNVIAELAKKLIEEDIGNMEPFGKPDDNRPERKTWATFDKLARMSVAFGIDRKLVKRNVMTFSYASKEFGMSEQHFEDTMAPLELKLLKKEITNHPFGDDEDEWRLAARYLAKRVLAAIKEVVKLPAEAMEFMQKLAKLLAHEGKPLRWVTPAGVTCINRYHESTTQRVELFCYDKGVKRRTELTIATGLEKPIAKEKAAAGIAANFTHSMDASHLLLSVGVAADEGITDIATVHDSFGCLACDAPRFLHIIRETLMRMYADHDILSELLESARADLTPASQEKLPQLPEKGTLELKELLNAKYAFA
ncbi:DNA-directed RNA polymerase [Tardiphaga sp. 367_B4_N1_1]|uniref:DNA-directed RNA polymerase n=1 Tax=Tardiphaga sp. 367_B4_N1_1 TaxID=3240777 RepID=UPI003F228DA1